MDTEYCKFRRWEKRCIECRRICEFWGGFAWAWLICNIISLFNEPYRAAISFVAVLGFASWAFWRLCQYGRAVNDGGEL